LEKPILEYERPLNKAFTSFYINVSEIKTVIRDTKEKYSGKIYKL
jgi:hypothetical protein